MYLIIVINYFIQTSQPAFTSLQESGLPPGFNFKFSKSQKKTYFEVSNPGKYFTSVQACWDYYNAKVRNEQESTLHAAFQQIGVFDRVSWQKPGVKKTVMWIQIPIWRFCMIQTGPKPGHLKIITKFKFKTSLYRLNKDDFQVWT